MRHGIILLLLISGGVVNIQNTEELRHACCCDLALWTTVALRAPVDCKGQQEHSGELTQWARRGVSRGYDGQCWLSTWLEWETSRPFVKLTFGYFWETLAMSRDDYNMQWFNHSTIWINYSELLWLRKVGLSWKTKIPRDISLGTNILSQSPS